MCERRLMSQALSIMSGTPTTVVGAVRREDQATDVCHAAGLPGDRGAFWLAVPGPEIQFTRD